MNCGAVFEVCNGGSEATFDEATAMAPILGLCDAEEEAPCHLRDMKESEINEDSVFWTQKFILCFLNPMDVEFEKLWDNKLFRAKTKMGVAEKWW